jgi:hypothetical protein
MRELSVTRRFQALRNSAHGPGKKLRKKTQKIVALRLWLTDIGHFPAISPQHFTRLPPVYIPCVVIGGPDKFLLLLVYHSRIIDVTVIVHFLYVNSGGASRKSRHVEFADRTV